MIYPFMMKFYTGENYFTKILFSNVYKNPDVKLNYIEDGLGTYLKKSIFSTSKNVQRVFKILNKNSIFKKIDDYFVYCPELLLYDVKI